MVRVSTYNTRGGWANKYDHEQIKLLLEESDFLAILDPGIVEQDVHLVSIKGFICYYSLHPPNGELDDYCGGVLLYVRQNLDSAITILSHHHHSYNDSIWVKLSNWLMGFVYLPPSGSSFSSVWHPTKSPVDVFFDNLTSLANSHPSHKILTMGDFNTRLALTPDLRTNTWGSHWKRNENLHDMKDKGYQIVNPLEFTFFGSQGNSTIDFPYTTHPKDLSLQKHQYCPALSDHIPITSHIITSAFTSPPPRFFPYPTIQQAIHQSCLKPPALLDPLGKDFINQQEASLLQKIKQTTAPSSKTTPPPPFNPSLTPIPPLPPSETSESPSLPTVMPADTSETGPDVSQMTNSQIQNLISRFHARVKLGHTLSPSETVTYQRAKSAQRAHRQRTRRRKCRRLREQVESLHNDPKRYWQHIKRILNSSKRIKADPAEALEHMRNLSKAHIDLDTSGSSINHPRIPPLPDDTGDIETLVDDPLTEEEILSALQKMRNSASGEDGITVSMLKDIPVADLIQFFTAIRDTAEVPDSWNRGTTVLLPKGSKDTTIPSNLRGITLQPRLKRLYTLCLTQRLTTWAETNSVLPPTQNGFRPHHRTSDNLMIIRSMQESHGHSRSPLYLCTTDVQKAFDRVSRPLLFNLLDSWGLRGRHMEVLKAMYHDTQLTLRMEGHYSEFFACSAGVAQGDPLSPLLFILYISCLDLRDPDDPLLELSPVGELLLADDLTLLSTTIAGINRKLDSLQHQLDALGLTLHPEKSKFLPLTLYDRESSLLPELNGTTIPLVEELDINGYLIKATHFPAWDCSSTFDRHHLSAKSASKDLLRARRHLGIQTPIALRTLYLTLVESQYTYSLEAALGISNDELKKADSLQRQIVRSILGIHEKAPTCVVMHDMGLTIMALRLMIRCTQLLIYTVALPPDRLIQKAMTQSYREFQTRRKGWFALYVFNAEKLLHRTNYYENNLFDGYSPQQLRDLHRLWDPATTADTRQTVLGKVMELITKNIHYDALHQIHNSSALRAIREYSPLEIKRPLAPYLKLDRRLSRNFARLRSSTHNLRVQKERQQGTDRLPYEKRFCPRCPDKIESEFHAFLECPEHRESRKEWMTSIPHLLGRQYMAIILNPAKAQLTATAKFVKSVMDTVDTRYSDEATVEGDLPEEGEEDDAPPLA